MAFEDVSPLRHCLDALAGVTTAAAGSALGASTDIVNSLLDALATLVPLSFAFARVHDPMDGAAIESGRGSIRPDCVFASTRIGTHGEIGTLLVASDNPSFPNRTDSLVLQ